MIDNNLMISTTHNKKLYQNFNVRTVDNYLINKIKYTSIDETWKYNDHDSLKWAVLASLPA